ncbi:MAG: ATP-binding protein, partial [Pseudomonadota bacterium]
PLGEVAHQIARAGGAGFKSGVIVVKGGAYFGYVSPGAILSALEAENTRRAHQLRRAGAKVEALSREASAARQGGQRTLARFGHEVRTPLTAMLGHTERLLRQEMTPEARKSLDVLVRASESLAALVTRSIEAGQLGSDAAPASPVPFAPKDLAEELIELWRPRAEAAGLTLTAAVDRALPARLVGDAPRIRQVLGNLISNAVKYTASGSVAVELSGLAREEGQIDLEARVLDRGPGIAAGDIERLFQPFERLGRGAGRPVEGAGLGLNISASLASAMGGNLHYTPRPGGGSIFCLRLPLERVGPRLAAEAPARPQKPTRATIKLGAILLIEDHAASRALIESALSSAGWRVDTVSTLAEARRCIDQTPYQAILCDYFLRDGQGDVLIKMLRGHDNPNRDALCLAVTADASEARRRHCLAAGFVGVIVKPIREADLVITLADYIAAASSDPRGASAISA